MILLQLILIIFIFATFPLYLFAVSPNDQAEIDLANRLDKQAKLDYKQGRHTDAETLYKRSLKIREKIYGSDQPEVSTSFYKSEFLFCFRIPITIFEIPNNKTFPKICFLILFLYHF